MFWSNHLRGCVPGWSTITLLVNGRSKPFNVCTENQVNLISSPNVFLSELLENCPMVFTYRKTNYSGMWKGGDTDGLNIYREVINSSSDNIVVRSFMSSWPEMPTTYTTGTSPISISTNNSRGDPQ